MDRLVPEFERLSQAAQAITLADKEISLAGQRVRKAIFDTKQYLAQFFNEDVEIFFVGTRDPWGNRTGSTQFSHQQAPGHWQQLSEHEFRDGHAELKPLGGRVIGGDIDEDWGPFLDLVRASGDKHLYRVYVKDIARIEVVTPVAPPTTMPLKVVGSTRRKSATRA